MGEKNLLLGLLTFSHLSPSFQPSACVFFCGQLLAERFDFDWFISVYSWEEGASFLLSVSASAQLLLLVHSADLTRCIMYVLDGQTGKKG